jgi:hypothetical protein
MGSVKGPRLIFLLNCFFLQHHQSMVPRPHRTCRKHHLRSEYSEQHMLLELIFVNHVSDIQDEHQHLAKLDQGKGEAIRTSSTTPYCDCFYLCERIFLIPRIHRRKWVTSIPLDIMLVHLIFVIISEHHEFYKSINLLIVAKIPRSCGTQGQFFFKRFLICSFLCCLDISEPQLKFICLNVRLLSMFQPHCCIEDASSRRAMDSDRHKLSSPRQLVGSTW